MDHGLDYQKTSMEKTTNQDETLDMNEKNINQTSSLNPIPGPSPIDYQTTATYRENYSDGSYVVYDKFNKDELYSVKSDGSVKILNNRFYSKIGNINVSNVSYDDRKDVINIKDSNGKLLFAIKNNEKTVEDYTYNGDVTIVNKYNYDDELISVEEHQNGIITVYLKDGITKTKTIYADGTYEVYEDDSTIKYDSNNNKLKTLKKDGSYEIYEKDQIIKYDTNNHEYMHVYNDGKIAYIKSNVEDLVIYPDGTFYNHDGKKGIYVIDNVGNIKCIDSDNNTYFYNANGVIVKIIDNTGKEINYDYDHDTLKKTITKDGQKYASRINHIEYDEEAYNTILNSLNNIGSSHKGKFNNLCSNISSAVNSFPDKYSSGSIDDMGSSIEGHIDLMSSLSEMTNYSLLAYQACDNALKDNLNYLIDALFDEKELANDFKKSISYTIEDRDNDGILEYKLDTDFSSVSDNLIPMQIYQDEDGNILYFNNNGKLLNVDGSNIKINYGGENFILNFGKNGCAILKDHNGNPISIFGEYNISSGQYGGNQGVFFENGLALLKDENINNILNKYFEGASNEEKINYLTSIAFKGCGYVAFSNMVFKKMEGYEEDFNDKFGYPMYNIIYKNNEISVDYNYEPLTLELCSEYYGKDWDGNKVPIKNVHVKGMSAAGEYRLEYYLMNKYHLYDYHSEQSFTYLSAQHDYVLESTNDIKQEYPGFNAHAMVITEKTNDGKTYVSSWGRKYQYELMPDGFGLEEVYPLSDNCTYGTSDNYNGVKYDIEYWKKDGEVGLTATRKE